MLRELIVDLGVGDSESQGRILLIEKLQTQTTLVHGVQ